MAFSLHELVSLFEADLYMLASSCADNGFKITQKDDGLKSGMP